MKTSILCIALLLISSPVFANSTIESASGSSCEQTDFQPWEVSAGAGYGLYDNYYDKHDSYREDINENQSQVGLKLTYRFGGAKQIDCARFQDLVEREQEAYTTQLELKVKQLQAQLAKQERVNTQKVKFQ